ncbi:MAG: RNA methyltransferase [Armatimonadetes bacterium]|nr:RNA methyltransferase [Armatimonadota bacterium]
MRRKSSNRALARRPPANLNNVRIILIDPQFPGNIGSTCRAMKTMGLTDLVLVRPPAYRDVAEARSLAHGALDVLEAARAVETLEEAIGDLHLLVGTTNRKRIGVLPDMMTVAEAAEEIVPVTQDHKAGILFGREDRGLSTEELTHCQVIATIPVAEGMPSLNLSHAVQVVAYELFRASLGPLARRCADLADLSEQEALIRRVNDLLLAVGFRPFRDDPESFVLTLRRVFGRAGMERRDVRALHKLISTLQHRLATCGEAPPEQNDPPALLLPPAG